MVQALCQVSPKIDASKAEKNLSAWKIITDAAHPSALRGQGARSRVSTV